MSDSTRGAEDSIESGGEAAKLAIAWTIVGVPLAYGIITTAIKAVPLFTGG